MPYNFGKYEKSLMADLELMKFGNLKAILGSAVELPNPSYPSIRSLQTVQMEDLSSMAKDGITIRILAHRMDETEPWDITNLSAEMTYQPYGDPNNSKTVKIFSDPGELLPTRNKLIAMLAEELHLVKTKDELKSDTELRRIVTAIGFKDFDGMVDKATIFLGHPVLHKFVDVKKGVGSGRDQIKFTLTLSPEEMPRPKSIQSINGSYLTPTGKTYETTQSSSVLFKPQNGNFPPLKEMYGHIFEKEQRRLIPESKAVSISQAIKSISSSLLKNLKKSKKL